MKFNNEAYKEVMKCLVGDIFYTNNLSITSRISIIRRYSEIILRKLIDIPETEYMTIGGKNIKRYKESINDDLLTNAIDIIHKYGDDNTHTEQILNPTDKDLNIVLDAMFNLYAYLFIDFFTKNPFGSDSRIVVAFSILPPILRFKVLNNLFEKNKNNQLIIDKLVLAILKSYSKEKAYEWLDTNKELLLSLDVATDTARHDLINRFGLDIAEIVFANEPHNMYELCVERISNVSELIDKNGVLYSTFEESKHYYELKGFVSGITDEINRFNSIMEFCYLGRRKERTDYPELYKYITSDVKVING